MCLCFVVVVVLIAGIRSMLCKVMVKKLVASTLLKAKMPRRSPPVMTESVGEDLIAKGTAITSFAAAYQQQLGKEKTEQKRGNTTRPLVQMLPVCR